MPRLFKLIKEEFSEVYQEQQWTYACLLEFTFNRRRITKITITDYIWKKPGRTGITQDLVLNLLKVSLHGESRDPNQSYGNRQVFVEERIPYGEKDYLLVFWFEDNNSDWLWVRNCYPIS